MVIRYIYIYIYIHIYTIIIKLRNLNFPNKYIIVYHGNKSPVFMAFHSLFLWYTHDTSWFPDRIHLFSGVPNLRQEIGRIIGRIIPPFVTFTLW